MTPNRRAVACGLAAALFAVGPSFARLPDWARQIAERAPSLPEGVSPDERHVLIQETTVTVEADGRLRTYRRVAEQFLRVPQAPEATDAVIVDDSSKVVTARGWHVPYEGRSERSIGLAVEFSVGNDFLNDSRARVVSLEGVGKGSLVFYEFEVLDTPFSLDRLHVFSGSGAPIARAVFETRVPPGWTVRHAWLRGADVAPTVSGNVTRWELTGIRPPPRASDLTEPAGDANPALVVSFAPPEGAAVKTPHHHDWQALGAWFDEISAGRSAATAAIEAAGRTAVEGLESGRLPRIAAMARFVRDGVRYVAKEIGIGRFQPRPADQVLGQRHGDCKDKAALLRAMLATQGIPAFAILVNASREKSIADDVPAISAFNHVILGVALDPDEVIPDWAGTAVVDAGEIGRLLVVDVTDDRTAPGWLPGYLVGKSALVVDGARSRFVRLPGEVPEAHRIERDVEGVIEPDGRLRFTRTTRIWGEPAADARSAWRRSTKNWRARAEHAMRDEWPGATVQALDVTPETPEGAFVEVARIAAPMPPGNPPMIVPLAGASDDLDRASLGRREVAVVYPHPIQLRFNTRWKGSFPTSEPQSRSAEGEGWTVTARIDTEGDELRASWEARLSRRRFEVAEFEELKRLWTAADRAGRLMAPLEAR